MSLFSRRSRKNKGTRPPSPLMLKVEEIDTKLDALLAMRPSTAPSQQQQRQPVEQSPVTQHEQGFEPFSDFEPMQQEGSSNGE